ncbi:hypothetical protein ABZ281_36850, partial [Streptomyces sp. NPDC006265]
PPLDWFRSAHLDLVVIELAEFRTRGTPGRPDPYLAEGYVVFGPEHAPVVLAREEPGAAWDALAALRDCCDRDRG